MSELKAAEEELIDDFRLFDNWMDRYQYIIDLGKQLPDFPEEWRTDDCKIRGCQSQVWLRTECADGRLSFQAISDSAILQNVTGR